MHTRYQTRAALYDQVLDEPNMLESILDRLDDPKDIVHLSLCGAKGTRFHNTLQHVLSLRREQQMNKKIHTFCTELESIARRVRESPSQTRSTDDLFEYLMDNLWYKDVPELRAFDATVERKLIEFAVGDVYSHNALNYLGLLFGNYVKCRFESDELVEYIIDSNGNVHDI
jgi:hypothetical protein